MHKRHILRIALTLLCLLVSMPLMTAQAEESLPPTVTPSIGVGGTRFLFSASGFSHRERLSFWVNRPDGQIKAVYVPEENRADSDGKAVWTWESPSDAQEGVWQLVVHGQNSGVEYQITFTIGNPPPPTTENTGVSPTAGYAGDIYSFFATGFKVGEWVDAHVRGPNGEDLVQSNSLILHQPVTDAGRIDGSWTAPLDVASGSWHIDLRGSESNYSVSIYLTIKDVTVGPGSLEVSPTVGFQGMRFVVTAVGFTANEKLSIWLNLPDGSTVPAEIEGVAKAAPDGRAGWTWVAPADAQLGVWQMVAHGLESNHEVAGSFTIQAAQ